MCLSKIHPPCYAEKKIARKGRFYDEKNKPKTGVFALGAGSVFCGLCAGAPHWQFSVEQQCHIRHLCGIYFVNSGTPLCTIWEKTEVII